MATSTLKVIITTKKAGTGDKEATQGLKGLSKQLLVAGAASLALKKAFDFTKEATLLAARVKTLGVVTEQLGKNVGRSVGEIRNIESSIQDLGITTQASRQAVAQMIQSQVDLSRATELARLSQDAAVIANTNSSDAFQRLITVVQTGNIRMARTIGLNVSFAKGQEKLADSLGKTTDELTDTEIIQSRVNTLLEAGTQITGTYEAAMDTAGKQLGSTARHIEEFMRLAGEDFEPILAQIVKRFNEMLSAQNELTQSQKDLNDMGFDATHILAMEHAGLIDLGLESDNYKDKVVELTNRIAAQHERERKIFQGKINLWRGLEGPISDARTSVESLGGAWTDYAADAIEAMVLTETWKHAAEDNLITDEEQEHIRGLAAAFGESLPDIQTAITNFNQLGEAIRSGEDPLIAAENVALGIYDNMGSAREEADNLNMGMEQASLRAAAVPVAAGDQGAWAAAQEHVNKWGGKVEATYRRMLQITDLLKGGDGGGGDGGGGGGPAPGTSGLLEQHGGPVQAGRPYVVGERGPEMFVPQQPGTVINHNQSFSFMNNISNAVDGQALVGQLETVLRRRS